MGTEKPTLSVLIPNHNHGGHLADCLDSLLSQSRPPDEIVVVDDASTDDSWAIVSRYARRYPQIRPFRNPRRVGVMGTLNRAQREAWGEFVYGGAADDRILPGTFARMMDLLEAFPQAGVCFGHTLTLNPNTGYVTDHPLELSDESRFFMPHELAEAMGSRARPGMSVTIPGNAAIWRRSAHLHCGGYREELRWHADWFTLQVVAMRHGACFVPEPLAINRVDRGSYSLAGQECWESQKEVLTSLLALMTADEFRDVWPLFRAGKLLSQFAPWVARVVAGRESYWTPKHVLLVENSLLQFHRQLLEDGNPLVRRGAAVCLGMRGTAAVSAVAAVASAKHDRHPQVRCAAAAAHLQIRASSPRLTRWCYRASGWTMQAVRFLVRRLKRALRPAAAVISAGTDRRVMLRLGQLDAQNRRLSSALLAELQSLRQEVAELRADGAANRAAPDVPVSADGAQTEWINEEGVVRQQGKVSGGEGPVREPRAEAA
jgi:glycosyltransferase involved in cell wall biosynthesis